MILTTILVMVFSAGYAKEVLGLNANAFKKLFGKQVSRGAHTKHA